MGQLCLRSLADAKPRQLASAKVGKQSVQQIWVDREELWSVGVSNPDVIFRERERKRAGEGGFPLSSCRLPELFPVFSLIF